MQIFEVKVKTNASKNEVKLIDNKKLLVAKQQLLLKKEKKTSKLFCY